MGQLSKGEVKEIVTSIVEETEFEELIAKSFLETIAHVKEVSGPIGTTTTDSAGIDVTHSDKVGSDVKRKVINSIAEAFIQYTDK